MPEMGRIAGRERVGVPFVKASDSAADVDAPGGRPVALSGIMPKYPYGARARGEAGQVTVAVRVNGKGAVESAVVVSSSGYPALDESAVAATKKARFKPAEKEGQPVPSNMNLKFEFRLEER